MDNGELIDIENHLRQEHMIDSSLRNGDGPWTVVNESWNDGNGTHGGCYIVLSQPQLRNKILNHTSWDLLKGQGRPEFKLFENDVQYFRNDAAPDFEPLVIHQEFHGVVPDSILLSEEFCLLMDLWRDPDSGNYFHIKDSGSKELAVQINNQKIEIRTPILKRYIAARQLDAVLLTDSIVSTSTSTPASAFTHLEIEDLSDGDSACIARNIGKVFCGKVFSRVLVKRILFAPPKETSGIWPWDNTAPRDYPEFVIDEAEDGQPVKFTCSPDRLANNFGRNPSSPHYLTPVFFRPGVLQKYYDNPSLYSVEDGHLSCAQKWSVRIDNDNPDFVSAFLGDLGRDLPQEEWHHWLSFNTPPLQKMSETNFRRSFLGQIVTSNNPEHHFKTYYKELNEAWVRHWGWPLYRDAVDADADIIRRLRIPVDETSTEFHSQLLNLALVLVDLLNEKELSREITEGSGMKGIDKLQSFLKERSYQYADRDIALLRKVQRMRSRVAAHTSGSNGQAFLKEELSGRSGREYVQQLMLDANQMMHELIEFTTQSNPMRTQTV